MMFDHWPSVLLYLLVFVGSATLVYFGNRKSTAKRLGIALTALGLAIPILLAGLRHEVGRDYPAYARMIENVQAGREMSHRAIEPLSTFIIQFSASFGDSVMMFTLFSTITVLFAYFGMKRMLPADARYIASGFFLYLCIAFPITLNVVRSGAAIALVTFALSYLVDAKARYRLLKFIGWTGAAALFHMSAIICLPIGVFVYVVSRHGKIHARAERMLLGAAIFVALAFPLFGGLIADVPVTLISNYARFLRHLGEHFSIPIANMIVLGMLAFALIVAKNKARQDSRVRILYAIALYYIPLSLLVGWLTYYPSMSRLVFFLEPAIFVLLVYVVWEIKGRLFAMIPLQALAIALVLTFSIAMSARNLVWAHALPYNTIFSQEHGDARKD